MYPSVAVGLLVFSTWRLLALAAILVCGLLVLARATRLGYPGLSLLVLGAIEIMVGLAGAKLYDSAMPLLLHTEPESGLASTGGVLAMLVFGLAYVRFVLRLPALEIADAMAFTLPLFLGIARLGCMLNGCCFGRIAAGAAQSALTRLLTLPVHDFSPASPAGTAYAHLPADTRVWNLPLMLSVNAIVSLLVIEVVFRHRCRWRLPTGIVLGTAFATEGCGRFVLEFLRQDAHVGGTAFNPWQLGVAAVTALAILFTIARARSGGLRYVPAAS